MTTLDPIRIDGAPAVEIAATVRRLNPGRQWVAITVVDDAGCKLRARRTGADSPTEYAIHHLGSSGCTHAGAIQRVTVVPVSRDDDPTSLAARLVLARARKRLEGMVAYRGRIDDHVLAVAGTYDVAYRAAANLPGPIDVDNAEWAAIVEAVA